MNMQDLPVSADTAQSLGITDAEEGQSGTLDFTIKSVDAQGDIVITPTSAEMEGGDDEGAEGGGGNDDEGGEAEPAPSGGGGSMKPAVALVIAKGKKK